MMKVPKEKIELCVATDSSRPVLQHIFYDSKRKKLVASDGFMLAVVPVVCDHDQDALIPPEAIIQARKKKLDLVFTDNGAYVCFPGMKVMWALLREKYPDYTQIMNFSGPKPKTHMPSIAFSMQRLIKLHRVGFVEKNQSMRLWCKDRSAPIIIESGQSQCLLMPMHPGFHNQGGKADLDTILEMLKEVVAEGQTELSGDLVKLLRQYFGFPLKREKEEDMK